MRTEILQSIRALLQTDDTVLAEQREDILRACSRKSSAKARLGGVRQAAEVVGCHPKTIYRYVRRGLLHPVRYSQRKVRFDLNEVEAFAANGLSG
jgi:excisionase family DNA binding protein